MDEHYRGFIDTCARFGMAKQAADLLYKRAQTLARLLVGGKRLNPRTINYMRNVISANSSKLGPNTLKRFEEFARARGNIAKAMRGLDRNSAELQKYVTHMNTLNQNMNKFLSDEVYSVYKKDPNAFIDPRAAKTRFADFDTRGRMVKVDQYGRRVLPVRHRGTPVQQPAATVQKPTAPVQQPTAPAPVTPSADITEAASKANNTVANQAINQMAGGGAQMVPVYGGGGDFGAWMAQNPVLATAAIGVPTFMAGSWLANRNRA